MAKREKMPVIEQVSPEQAEKVLGDYAQADARIQELTAEMDQKITSIRDKYADRLTELSEKKDEASKILHFYAEKNRDMFSKKRSLEMSHGKIGFRMGTPKLKTKKGFTWASVMELCKEFAPDWVRVKEEPNKELILANREVEGMDKLIDKVGVIVDADETFFIELKKEEISA